MALHRVGVGCFVTTDGKPEPKRHAYRVPLEYEAGDRRDFAQLVGMLGREWEKVGDIPAIVLRALREAAQRT